MLNRSIKITTLIGCICVPTTGWADVFDVYIAAGQSNMDGRGLNSELVGSLASYKLPQADVPIRYTNPGNDDGTNAYQTDWVALEPGYCVPPGYSGALPSTKFGPEVSFGRAMADDATTRRVAIVKVAHGGTNLQGDWDPSDEINGPKGYMYAGFETAVPEAIQALQAMGHSVEIRGMIWHQGESDGSGTSAATQAAYEANLTEFIQVVRQDLGYPNLPFLVGELESVDGGREAVRAAQANVAAAMDFVEFIPSEGLAVYSDGTHFTAASQIELGQQLRSHDANGDLKLAGRLQPRRHGRRQRLYHLENLLWFDLRRPCRWQRRRRGRRGRLRDLARPPGNSGRRGNERRAGAGNEWHGRNGHPLVRGTQVAAKMSIERFRPMRPFKLIFPSSPSHPMSKD